MGMMKKWSEMQAKAYPELIPVRFPEGTRNRLKALADASYMRIAAEYEKNPNLDVAELPPLQSPSTIVRRAVKEYLEREEER